MSQDYFDAVIGHETVKARLRRLIAEERLPHAMIFAGPEGLGKALMARAVAETLSDRPLLADFTHLSCDADTPFIEDGGTVFYLDVIGTMLRVDQFRQLQEKLMLRASGSRVCIINHVETMNKEFANRMLKTLEEPPEGVHFILVTSQPDLLLPTIVSRCAIISFEPVGDEEMLDGLVRQYGGTAESYRQAVLWGGGNVARVLALKEGKGLEALQQALSFLQVMARQESQEVFRWIQMLLRDMVVMRSGVPAGRLRLGQYAHEVSELLPAWPDSCIFSLQHVLDEAGEAILRHVNVRLVWDAVCIRFIRAKGGI